MTLNANWFPEAVPGKPSGRYAHVIVLRETTFVSDLDFDVPPPADALALLAACVLALRRLGTGTSRGRGRVACALHDAQGQDVTHEHVGRFRRLVKGPA